MFETDDDRLAAIQALGGVTVTASGICFAAIFDAEFTDGLDIEGSAPVLTVRSSDATRVQLRKGVRVDVEGASYVVRRIEPDGTGISRVVLSQ